jgi:ABC-type amino acid transport substrate-binding protein
LGDGLRALRAGRLDAFVYDKPLLAWAIRQGFASRLKVLDVSIEPQSYAFALSPDSPLRKPLSIEMLHTIQSDEWAEARVRYLRRAAELSLIRRAHDMFTRLCKRYPGFPGLCICRMQPR